MQQQDPNAVVNKVVPDRKKGTKHSNSNKSLGV